MTQEHDCDADDECEDCCDRCGWECDSCRMFHEAMTALHYLRAQLDVWGVLI